MAKADPEAPRSDEETSAPSGASEPALSFYGWLLLGGLVILAVLSFAPNAATRLYTWPWYLYGQTLLLLPPVAFIAGVLARGTVVRLGGTLDVGFVLWAVAALAGAWWSPHRETSLPAALLPLSGVSLTYVLRRWLGRHPGTMPVRAGKVFGAIAGLAAAFVAVSWGYWFVFDALPARAHGLGWTEVLHIRNIHPLGHSIYTAGFAVLTLPLLAVQAWMSRGLGRVALLLAVAAALGLIMLSSSRGGVLGIGAMVAIGGGLVLRAGEFSRRTKLLVLAAGVLLAAGLVAMNPRLRELATHGAWSPVSSESNQQRMAMMQAGWLMGADRPLVGWGPGTVSLVYPRYRAQLVGGVDNVLELHNTPVQMWAELGTPGVLAMLALATGVVLRARRLRPSVGAARPGCREDLVRAWGLVFALGGYGVFALTDHQLDVPLFVIVLAGMLAVLAALTSLRGEEREGSPSRYASLVAAAGLAGGVAVIGWQLVPDLRARHAFVKGVIALEHGSSEGFHVNVARARELAPWEPFYANQLAVQLMNEMDAAGDEGRQAEFRARAVTALQQSLEIAPAQEFCHTNLGWLLLDSGKPAEAGEHFRAAARLVPDKGGVYWGWGLALILQGKEEAGRQAFALEWINDPRTLAHPFWQRDESAERRTGVKSHAIGMLEEIATANPPPSIAARAAYLQALIEWWFDPDPAATVRLRNAAIGSEQREFFDVLLKNVSMPGDAPQPHTPWKIVMRAWSADAPTDVLAGLPPAWAQWRAALAARIVRNRDSFGRFVTGVGADRDGLVWRDRPERVAFGMLARNSDGLRVVDRTVREHNVLAELLPSPIFLRKGWLPTQELTRLANSARLR